MFLERIFWSEYTKVIILIIGWFEEAIMSNYHWTLISMQEISSREIFIWQTTPTASVGNVALVQRLT